AMAPWWENFLNGKSGVQLVHRLLAYLVTGWIAWMWARSRKLTLDSDQRNAMQAVLIVVFLQFLLGVLTLVYAVPLSLGVLHQVNALLLLLATAWLLHRVRKPASGTSGSGAAGLPSQTP
ncbi:MAG: COX15/CtaA family protein, partial [Bacteroidota bacterium]